MFEGNIDKSNVKAKIRVEYFHFITLKKFYVAIWSCMKLKDVFEILSLLMLKFCGPICVHLRKWTMCITFGKITIESFYYLKDWNMYIMLVVGYLMRRKIKCCPLTMNPTRCFKIQSRIVFSLSPLGEICCQRIRYNART